VTPNLDDYVDVAERIRQFKAKYPEGSLQSTKPELYHVGDKTFVYISAAAYRTPDDECPGQGSAWEPVPGPTPFTRDSEVMNAETSAWGRAIVALGFETKKIASANEVRNRQPPERDEEPGSSTEKAASTPGDGGQDRASSRSEGFQAPLPASEKPVPEGVVNELKMVLKLLNSSFPEHPGENRKWEDVAKEHCRDTYNAQSVVDMSLDQAWELVAWLEDQYTMAAKEAAVPFG
jgi:hypothetical protein